MTSYIGRGLVGQLLKRPPLEAFFENKYSLCGIVRLPEKMINLLLPAAVYNRVIIYLCVQELQCGLRVEHRKKLHIGFFS